MTTVAYAALWVFVFSLPWEVLGASGGISLGARLTGGLALGLTLAAITIRGRFRRLHVFHLAVVLFLLWTGLNIALFYGSAQIPKKFYTFLQLSLVPWMIWEIARTWRRQLGLLLAYVLGAYVAAFSTIWLYHSKAASVRRFSAGATDPNDLAMTLALALPMAWYLGLSFRQPLLRWLCRAYLPVAVLAIGLTGSRGGLVTTIVALMVVPLTMDRLTPGRLVTAIVLLTGSAALAAAYVPDTIVKRLSTTTSEVEDARFGGRFKFWVAGIHAFEQKPITGYGVGSFVRAITPELGDRANVAHNTYLSVLVEEGMVGLFFYLLMFVAVYRSIRRLPKLERRFALVLFGTLTIAILPLTWEDRKPVWFILAALLDLSQTWITAGGIAVRPWSLSRGGVPPRPRAGARGREPIAVPAAADRGAVA